MANNELNTIAWRYTASSGEVVATDGTMIARDVPEQFGHLLEAAPELWTALDSLVAMCRLASGIARNI